MNSLEAKRISFDAADKEINGIIDQIKQAAKMKSTQISVPEISQAAASYFKSNGFEVMTISDISGSISVCTISWS